MNKRVCKCILTSIGLFVVLILLNGCTAFNQYLTVEAPHLSPAEEVRVGGAVEGKLIQLLGGPYHDKVLADDLNRLSHSHGQGPHKLSVSVADRGMVALYPLPGGRVIMTRGLLSEIRHLHELESLLEHAAALANSVYKGRVMKGVVEATEEVLSDSESFYAPDSASIRLARLFEKEPCEQDCLTSSQSGGAFGKVRSQALPDSVKRLSTLQPGYDLATKALKLEKSDNHTQAIQTYLQAAATTPDEPRILVSLGLAYLKAGQLQSARLYLHEAARLQPDYYQTQMGLGYLYLKQAKLSQAQKALSSSVRLLPVAENLFLLAEVREKSGDIKGALLLYRHVMESDRDSKLGRTSASRLAQLTGDS